MTVPKGRRTESRFEVLYNATKLTDEISILTLRSFGIYSRNSIFRRRYDCMVNDRNREDVDDIIEMHKVYLIQAARNVEEYLKEAKSLYPGTIEKYELRNSFQLKALEECTAIKIRLHVVARFFNVDLNLFKDLMEILNKEIRLISGWLRSDEKIYKPKLYA